MRLSGTVFWNYLRDLISLQQDESSELLIFRNVDKVQAAGSELELSTQFANGLAGNISYSYTAAKDQRSSQLLVNSPQHLGKLNISVPLLSRRLFASGDAQYESSRKTLQGTRRVRMLCSMSPCSAGPLTNDSISQPVSITCLIAHISLLVRET